MHDTELEEAIHILGGRDAIQKDLDKLEGWADRKLMQFRKRKCEVMHLGCVKVFMHQCSLGTDGLCRGVLCMG